MLNQAVIAIQKLMNCYSLHFHVQQQPGLSKFGLLDAYLLLVSRIVSSLPPPNIENACKFSSFPCQKRHGSARRLQLHAKLYWRED